MAGKAKGASEPYTAEQIDRIIKAVRLPIDAEKRADFQKSLNFSAFSYLHEKDDPTPAQLRDRLQAINMAAQKLLDVLGADQGTGPCVPVLIRLQGAASDLWEQGPPTAGSIDKKVMEALEGVLLFQRWAAHAAAEIHRDIKPRGRSRNQAMLYFAVDLANTYERAFGKRPGVSTNPVTAKRGGPFVRFVVACLEELGEAHTLEAVARWARIAKDWDLGITIRLRTHNQ